MAEVLIPFLSEWWPHLLALSGALAAVLAGSHAILTKDDTRAATGWLGVILLAPLIGSALYLAAGINRLRRESLREERAETAAAPGAQTPALPPHLIAERFGRRFAALCRAGDRISPQPLTSGNSLQLLDHGAEAYEAMLQAIEGARRSVLLQSYIFDNDREGQRFVAALAAAQARGVAVRVLIDAVGVRYSRPAILGPLRAAGLRAALFNGRLIVGLKLPYANLRTHRKLLLIDGETAFAGGLNIREGFSRTWHGDAAAQDTHFQITGPVVRDLLQIAVADWQFASGELLSDPAFAPAAARPARPARAAGAPVLMRAIASGPDARLESTQRHLLTAISVARHAIRICTPYFLPDRELLSALSTAALRGVEIDILLPGTNNLTFVDRAMRAQFAPLLQAGARIWRSLGPFDHSKLLSIDNCWSLIGSSNLDPRSLRLNFEVDLEVYDAGFANRLSARIAAGIAGARPVTLAEEAARPLLTRLTDRTIRLASPYL